MKSVFDKISVSNCNLLFWITLVTGNVLGEIRYITI